MILRENGTIVAKGAHYRLTLVDDPATLSRAPYADLTDAAGLRWSRLSLLASAHTVRGHDESLGVESIEVVGDVVRIALAASLWTRKTLELYCGEHLSLRLVVEGDGNLDDVVMLGGDAVLPGGASGLFRSSIGFSSVLVPVPTEPVQFVRPAHTAAVLGIVGDADPGRLNGVFSPPPLVFGLGRERATSATEPPGGGWIALHVREAVERLTFTTLRYEPLDGGFLLRLSYEGHTAVVGTWASPYIVFAASDSGWGVLDVHRADLEAHGQVPVRTAAPAWWREPLFCGWGAQCARAARDGGSAPELASAALYDEFLEVLAANSLDPGTIVIDDRWQEHYGTASPHPVRWPDLAGWVAAQHAAGRKVLLWWKAWDPEGLPAEECVVDPAGSPIAADPANPDYLQRLRAIITHLVSPAGIDADGFKVDFTQRAPSGRSLRAHEGVWGIAALHALLGIIHDAAHSAKADALVVTHALHPSFAGVSDMVRLNDVLERDVAGVFVPVVDQLHARAEIASRSQPGAPIDTDQWPMPDKQQWLDYARAQVGIGVPALYYLETIDNSGERIDPDDLARVAVSWKEYRESNGLDSH